MAKSNKSLVTQQSSCPKYILTVVVPCLHPLWAVFCYLRYWYEEVNTNYSYNSQFNKERRRICTEINNVLKQVCIITYYWRKCRVQGISRRWRILANVYVRDIERLCTKIKNKIGLLFSRFSNSNVRRCNNFFITWFTERR